MTKSTKLDSLKFTKWTIMFTKVDDLKGDNSKSIKVDSLKFTKMDDYVHKSGRP